MDILVNLETLESTVDLPYLVCTVEFNNSNRAALYDNMRKEQRQWGVLAKVLPNTGANLRARAIIYNVVVHMVLLYGSKS